MPVLGVQDVCEEPPTAPATKRLLFTLPSPSKAVAEPLGTIETLDSPLPSSPEHDKATKVDQVPANTLNSWALNRSFGGDCFTLLRSLE